MCRMHPHAIVKIDFRLLSGEYVFLVCFSLRNSFPRRSVHNQSME